MAVLKRQRKLLDILQSKESDILIRFTGVSHSYLRLVAYGHKRPSARVASLLEQGTGGRVTRRELRPDDWRQIWPELEGYRSHAVPDFRDRLAGASKTGSVLVSKAIDSVLSSGAGETITPNEASVLFNVSVETAAVILNNQELLAVFSRIYQPTATLPKK